MHDAFSIFVSRLSITDFVNQIEIYTNLILFHLEIYIILFLFESSI